MPDFCWAISLYSINWDDSGWLQYFHILFPSIKTFFPHIILKWSHIKINKDQWELLHSLGCHCGFVYDVRKVFKSWCGGNVKVTTSLWVLYCFLHRDGNIGQSVIQEVVSVGHLCSRFAWEETCSSWYQLSGVKTQCSETVMKMTFMQAILDCLCETNPWQWHEQ